MEERFQLEGDAAAIYEAQKVPAVFRPLAEAVLTRLGLAPGQRLVDIACGTGIVARLAAPLVMPGGRVTGVDLNASMLAVASAMPETGCHGIGWYCADVAALPFADGAFDVAICQQGLQYFPDKPVALAEMCRILVPGGRLALTVWSQPSPLFVALAGALGRHVGEEAAARCLAPFSFCDAGLIASLINGAGFTDVAATTVTVPRHLGPARQSLPREIAGSPIGPMLANAQDAVMDRIVAETAAGIAPYANGEGFVIAQHTNLFEARAG